MWGTTSPSAKLTGDSGSVFEARLIGDGRLFRSLAENWPLRLLGLLQQYLPRTDIAYRQRRTTEGDHLATVSLRYASDWRQDIDTAPAALRMTSSTTSGFDNMGTCEDATSVVVAFMRFETKRCRSG